MLAFAMAGRRKDRRAAMDALTGGAEAVPSGAKVGWDELLGMARTELDDDGLANEATRKKVAAKILARQGLEKPPYRMDAIRAAMAAYFADVEAGNPKGFKKVLAENGVGPAEFRAAKVLDADLQTVFEYVKKVQKDLEAMTYGEAPAMAQRSMVRLLTEEGCELNERAMEFALKTLRKETFGDSAGDDGQKGKSPIVYQISGVQVNNTLIAGDMMAKALPKGGVVDVEEVLKEIGAKEGTDGSR